MWGGAPGPRHGVHFRKRIVHVPRLNWFVLGRQRRDLGTPTVVLYVEIPNPVETPTLCKAWPPRSAE